MVANDYPIQLRFIHTESSNIQACVPYTSPHIKLTAQQRSGLRLAQIFLPIGSDETG